VNRPAVFISPHFFARHCWRTEHFCLTTAADLAVTGLPFSQADWKM
jgi:hypothetical protein